MISIFPNPVNSVILRFLFLYEEDLKPQVSDCDDVNGHNIPCWDVVVKLDTSGHSDISFSSFTEQEESEYCNENHMEDPSFLTEQ